jgi:hypothetical protein
MCRDFPEFTDQALKILGAFDQVVPENMLRVLADSDFRTIKDKVMAHVENSALKYVEINVSGKYEFDELYRFRFKKGIKVVLQSGFMGEGKGRDKRSKAINLAGLASHH